MMDHERTEKELQEIFEEIQQTYRTAMDDAVALQERTLKFARDLIENPPDEQETRNSRTTLEELAGRSRSQREHFERLANKTTEAYMKVLAAPADHHHKVEEARAELEEPDPS
ncbi:MAG TPA: hypothetical protein VK869_06200 [Rubrobacteraceae bacterium]|nr:hypothetical protein [Rubrobacteraceae bacterium]